MKRKTGAVLASTALFATTLAGVGLAAPANAEGGCGAPLTQYSVPPLARNQASLYGRTITLRGNSGYGCVWGKIEGGSAGDKVWVNRSNHPGNDLSNYPYAGAGQAVIPSGATSAFTPEAYNDSGTTAWVCGKIANRPDIFCTKPF